METILQIKNVERSYTIGRSSLEVLRGVSLEVKGGETLAIMGESGSGKSTLLHVMGGLDMPKKGSVFFRGEDIYSYSSAQRTRFRAKHVGFVFQSFHLLPELNILENVLLPSMAVRMNARKARERATELLTQVGLEERINHRPQELSGGEQQRVALARALMNDPDIVFTDEPTGNLDSKTGDKVLHYLFQLMADRGHTLVLVTHSKSVAKRCSRQLLLEDGVFI
jgi:predicted ABC-type transport system involved in lysophospholipase L1 biosynthesis ATPase subunit